MEEVKLYNCPHCHTDGVLPMADMRCPNCKQKIEQIPNVKEIESRDSIAMKTVSPKIVAFSFFGGLFVALIITWAFGRFNTDAIRCIHLFPMGLTIFMVSMLESDNFIILYAGYVIYIAIFACAFLYRKKRFFLTLLIIYIILLCLNIGGCAALLNMHIS